MVTGPLFKWFGSKWLLSKRLPKPVYDTIIEPYAGGAGYSLRYSHKRVIIAETNPHLILLWKWLINKAKESDIRDIPINIPEGTDIRKLGLSIGQEILLKTWQRTNNVGYCWTISPWGNKPGQWTANTRARVAEEVHHIKHWRFVEGGADSLWGTGGLATYYVDPPYEYNYDYGSSKPDYLKLSSTILSLKGQIIVSEALSKDDRKPRWLPFEVLGKSITSRRKTKNHHHSTELVYSFITERYMMEDNVAKKYLKGGESRLSLEGLRGFKTYSGKVVRAIYAHGESRRSRTVYFTDGSREIWSIYDLLGALIESRNK